MKKILVILLMALMLVACSSDPLVGQWYDESSGQMLTFDDDNTVTFGVATMDYRIEDDLLIFVSGDTEDVMQFKIEDDILELSFPDIDDFELYFKKIK